MTWFKRLSLIYFVLLLFYSIFSYSLTDPNLILSSWEPYWKFQTWMWKTLFNHPQNLAVIYGLLVSSLVVTFVTLLYSMDSKSICLRNILIYLLLLLSPLLFSYNALSHDVFNYIFNAKIVMYFEANPHVKTALDYSYDDWTRFMHNTHTPAPYGYGWTGLSVLPYMLGGGKFTLTWLLFRLYSLVSYTAVVAILYYVLKKGRYTSQFKRLSLFALNPLVLIEVISNSHNDLWMVGLALGAFALVVFPPRSLRYGIWIAISAMLLTASVSIKFATAVVIPCWFAVVFAKTVGKSTVSKLILDHWPLMLSFLLFIPLLTTRSQQFHPWYLTWVLTWLPLIRYNQLPQVTSIWLVSICTLSFSSLYRYIPWIQNGGFTDQVINQQKAVTWTPFIIALVISYIFNKRISQMLANRLQ